jgi:rhodanese-related sulfurtransferase
MMQLTDVWIDILTGHAAARFGYVDVRDRSDFDRQPPQYRVEHIPLGELPLRVPDMFDFSTELVVYGTTDAESESAEDILKSLGFTNVTSFEGGFEALARAGLV